MRIEHTAALTPDLNKHNQNMQHGTAPLEPNVNVFPTELEDKAQVRRAVDRLNEMAAPLQTDLKFKFHEALKEYYVEVVDPITDEVIKEIPPKKMLDMYAAMTELIGILEDRKI